MVRMSSKRTRPLGFSLLELLAVVTIVGIIAALIVPRVQISTTNAKTEMGKHYVATINSAVERFYIDSGNWPANDLSDIAADVTYFPDGVPLNPLNGQPYTLNPITHRVQ
jgi:prepilin-type N-terminal cleavage/methylation domain-containing protein